MYQSLVSFSEWLSSTGLSEALRQHNWVVPFTQTIHIICIGIVMGTIVMIDLRTLGLVLRHQSPAAMVRRLIPPFWIALLVLLCTGAILIIIEPNRSVTNFAFLAKMVLVITVSLLTLFLTRHIKHDLAYAEVTHPSHAGAKAVAGISLLIWVLIIFLGRWIAYFDPSLLGFTPPGY